MVIDQHGESVLNLRRRKLSILVVGVFVILGIRLFHLQVIRNKYYKKLSLSNRIQRERILAPRGLVRARDGSKLVVNVPVYQISILPDKIHNKMGRLKLACEWLDIDEERLLKNLSEWTKRYPDGREMTVVQAADKRQISILRENRDLFSFFKLVMKPRRQYPEGLLAAHVLGYVGEVTDMDLKRSRDLQIGDIIGRTGVEYMYEGYLRGKDGVRTVEISAEGTQVGEIDGFIRDDGMEEFLCSSPPVPGCDVYLTIDLDLQRAVERIFYWDKGCAIMMDPRTGGILAAVSRPVYDPNIFLEGVSEEKWKELEEDPTKPLFNRAVQATYPPGSIFKIITAYAGLRNGVVSENTYLEPCLGSYRFGNRYFGCWKAEGHGALSLYGAIVNSCDVYFYQVGEMLTADQFASAGRIFGLGRKTGIDLPSEVTGILPDHAYFDNRFGRNKWTKGHLLNYSIGQGELLVTPIQLCAMTAVFATRGSTVSPHVVARIVDPEGKVLHEKKDLPAPLSHVDRETIDLICNSMRGVTMDESGTGRAALIPGITIAGKTGTAQNPHGEDHALFVAYAPTESPLVVLTIVMENAGHGGAKAAPMAREILSAYFLSVSGMEGMESGPMYCFLDKDNQHRDLDPNIKH